jgi:hypothetical protein
MLDPPIILKPILPQPKADEADKRGNKVLR